MNETYLNQFSEQILRDAVFGLGLLAIVIVLNTILFVRIYLWFMRSSAKIQKASTFNLISLFVMAVLMMSLVQVGSIIIWAAVLYVTGLIENIRQALLFSGSCYTTLGIYSDMLPEGWKSVVFYIAFSGLFSFAIATSSMISMLTIVTKRLYKP